MKCEDTTEKEIKKLTVPVTIGSDHIRGSIDAGDKYQHVIVGTNDVTMTEIYWNPNDPNRSEISQEKLVPLNATSIVGVAGYYDNGDKQQHVVMGDNQVNIWELFWKPLPHY